MKFTPVQWLTAPEFAGIYILNCDGWTREEWDTPITRTEFVRRLALCTITGPVIKRTTD